MFYVAAGSDVLHIDRPCYLKTGIYRVEPETSALAISVDRRDGPEDKRNMKILIVYLHQVRTVFHTLDDQLPDKGWRAHLGLLLS